MSARHRPATGRPTVAELADQCGHVEDIDGPLACTRRPGHRGWHHLCRPGTRRPVRYLHRNSGVSIDREGRP